MSVPTEEFLKYYLIYPEEVPDPVPVGNQWIRPYDWTRKHGPAYIARSMRFTVCIFNARLPDGRREDIGFVLDLGHRRPGDGERRWIYGNVEILPDDILFIDHEVQWAYSPPEPTGEDDLEIDLAGDEFFRADLKDSRFAMATYKSLQNEFLTKDNGLTWWTAGDKGAARIVAYLRDMGDSYYDYFAYVFPGMPPTDRPRRAAWWNAEVDRRIGVGSELWEALKAIKQTPVAEDHPWYKELSKWSGLWQDIDANSDVYNKVYAHFTRLGWRGKTDAEIDAEIIAHRRNCLDNRVELVKKLHRIEMRPAGPMPDWQIYICDFKGANVDGLGILSADEQEAADETIPQRIRTAAENGRLSEVEFDELKSLM